MKTSSARGERLPVDRSTAWACTLTNALTLPGLGSLTGGRNVGYAQGALALAGFALSLYWMVKTALEWLSSGQLPTEFTRTLAVGLAGIVLYASAWLWALVTSLQLLREAKSGNGGAHREKGQREQP